LGVTVALLVGVVALYFGTFHSIVSIWWRSGTFAHGFLIVPISLYLIWDGRDRLRGLAPHPDYRALAILGALGFGWLGCRMASVLGLEQYFAAATIPVMVWAVLGGDVARRLAFPLGFLLLAVPVGEDLIPPLIDFTAAFTVLGIKLSGVPVLQEANHLSLPNGNWSVVAACSGLWYLIASVTVGVLFAYLSFRSWRRRALCVLASIVVPIFANGFRAYMIVMLGYLSDMRLATGIDHLIYGWVFFGVVMMLFFAVASRFRDDGPDQERELPAVSSVAIPLPPRRFALVGVGAILVAALWPAWAARVESPPLSFDSSWSFPDTIGPWSRTPGAIGWRPYYRGADLEAAATYELEEKLVGARVGYYRDQTQGAELVSSSNGFIGRGNHAWRRLRRGDGIVELASGDRLPVVEALLDSPRRQLLVWTWYWVNGKETTSRYEVKLREMVGKLLGRSPPAAGVTVCAFVGDDEEAARRTMTNFLDAALVELSRELAAVSESN